MFISAIIPCRNGSQYLKEAVSSLQQQDIQTEIIVVDDGSTDTTAKIASELGCIVKSIPHSGLSAARNTGLSLAQGELVLFLDHDDVMRKGTLQKLAEAISLPTSCGIVMAKAVDFISPELTEEEKKVLSPRAEPYYGLLSGAVLFRKEVFSRIGCFTEHLATGQTMDVLMRAEDAGIPTVRLDFIAVDRRLHNNNMGRTMQKQEHKDYASLLRRKLAVRRSS